MAENYQIGNVEIQISSTADKAAQSLTNLSDRLSNLGGTTKKSSATLGGLKLSMIAIAHAARLVGRFLASSITLSADYIESLNMMEVAFGSASSEAYAFAKSLNTAFGVDTSEAIKYISIFKQIASAIGIAETTATTMSEALTQIGYDIASLYNITVAEAMTKLQAGVVGQTKPLRSLGIDVTAASIDRLLKEEMKLSIGNRQLSQADKQIARTIIILKAGGNAWGDYAKTINTFSNQQKIFTSLITQAKRAIGDFFVGTAENAGIATKALWYINGALMAVVATLRAFIPETTSTGLNTLTSDTEEATEATDDLNEATKNLSFDKFNSLTDTSDSSSLYSDLLSTELADTYAEYLEEWNAKLEEIDYKAKTIRDDIMSWLGFTKNVDSVTGSVNFTFDKINKNLLDATTSITYIVSYLLFKGVYTKILSIASAITTLSTAALIAKIKIFALSAAFALLAVGIVSVISEWSNMSSLQKTITIFSALAAAIGVATVAIMLFHATWTLGLAAGAIAAGLALTTSAYIAAKKAAKSEAENVKTEATGGFLAQGEMFIARESGPELVGSIGNKTAVVNNDQIVSAVSSGVANAVAKTLGRNGSQKVEVSFNPNGSAIARAIMPFLTAENKNQNYVLSKS